MVHCGLLLNQSWRLGQKSCPLSNYSFKGPSDLRVSTTAQLVLKDARAEIGIPIIRRNIRISDSRPKESLEGCKVPYGQESWYQVCVYYRRPSNHHQFSVNFDAPHGSYRYHKVTGFPLYMAPQSLHRIPFLDAKLILQHFG